MRRCRNEFPSFSTVARLLRAYNVNVHGVVENAKDNTIQSYVTRCVVDVSELIFFPPRFYFHCTRTMRIHTHTLTNTRAHTHEQVTRAEEKFRFASQRDVYHNCNWKRNIHTYIYIRIYTHIVRALFCEFALKKTYPLTRRLEPEGI